VLGALEESLRRLATDYVDLYIAHLPDTRVGIDETLRAFDQVVRDGKVRYVGFSNWPAWMIGQALGLQGPWGMSPAVAIEMHYSLLCRDIEQEFPGLIGSTQLALLVWGPLSGGHLTGKYRQLDGGPATGRLISSEHLVPPSSERCRAVTDLLFGVSSRYSASPAQISLAWLLTRPIVTTIILGATDVGQLRENLQAARLQLEPDDVAILEAGTAPQRSYPHSLIERVAELERIRMARLGGGQG
jgi:aryl-alcohol dehydrogenase-like predicted oxidoreductase